MTLQSLRNNTLTLLCLLFIPLFFSQCGSKKSVVQPEDMGLLGEKEVEKLKKEHFPLQHMSLKAKVRYTDSRTNQPFNLNVRIEKDSFIWLSANFMGIEGIRALFTPDSIYIINRLNKTYSITDYSLIESYLQDRVSLSMLQEILVGNAPYELEKYRSGKDQTGVVFLAGVFKYVESVMYPNEIFRYSSMRFTHQAQSRKALISYDGFAKVNGSFLPHSLLVQTDASGDNVRISIDYSQVSTEEVHILPFKIPKGYAKE